MSADARIERARRALEEIGIVSATVSVEGHEREIAALRVPEEAWDEVLEQGERVTAALKAEGFRYVALDLRPADGPA